MNLTSRPDEKPMVIDTTAWSASSLNRLLVDMRNALTIEQAEMVLQEREMIAKELLVCLTSDEIRAIYNTDSAADLHKFNSEMNGNLGRCIRNEYELWIEGHHITEIWRAAEVKTPIASFGLVSEYKHVVGDKVVTVMCSPPMTIPDSHPCHPDNFSFSVIVTLWKLLKNMHFGALR